MNFRKAFSLFLITVLLVSNSGLAFTVHFCGGAISSFSALEDAEESCNPPEDNNKGCCARSADHSGCCDNKTIQIKDVPDEVHLKSIQPEVKAVPATVVKDYVFEAPELVSEHVPVVKYSFQEHSPPLFKLYQSFLLYA